MERTNFKSLIPYLAIGVFILLATTVFIVSSQLQKNTTSTQQARAATLTSNLPPLPSGLPATFEFGLFNEDITNMHPNVPYYWRYGYIAGWTPSNVTSFIQASLTHSPPVHSGFAYYWIYNSVTHCSYGAGNEVQKLNDASCMNQYYTDFKNFMIATHNATADPVVYVFEPDLDGDMQSDASNTNDNAALQPTKVGGSGMADVAGYADNYAAFHQAIAHIRDLYAPNVLLTDDISLWGTGQDLTICLRNGGCDWQTIANRTATYINSFGGGYNMLSFSFLDRDAAYYQISSGSNRWIWDDDSREPKYSTFESFLSSIVTQTNKRFIMWQIPNGNRQYLAENNTTGHYQDNKTEYFLNASNGRQHIQDWINVGAVGLMWGAGAGGQSHYFDAQGDGITNPNSISNGNPMGIATSLTSTVADDDGGYIRSNVASYYQQGALPLSGGVINTPTPTPSGPTSTPTPTPTAAPIQTIDFDTNLGGRTVEAPLTGQYPTNVIDWGTSSWYLAGPYNVDTTNNVTFNGGGITTASFTMVSPQVFVSFKAFGNGNTNVSASCTGNPTVTVPINANQWNIINTNWTQPCSSVTLHADNGWTTNFDDFVLSAPNASTPTPVPNTPTPAPTSQPDPYPPTITITNPLNGAIVSRNTTVTITANASDNVGVTKVEFYVNNSLKCTDMTSPYSCAWRVPTKRGATYTINAVAYDAANNTASQRISVTAR